MDRSSTWGKIFSRNSLFEPPETWGNGQKRCRCLRSPECLALASTVRNFLTPKSRHSLANAITLMQKRRSFPPLSPEWTGSEGSIEENLAGK